MIQQLLTQKNEQETIINILSLPISKYQKNMKGGYNDKSKDLK